MEQYLYIVDQMINYFTYHHAKYFVEICDALLTIGFTDYFEDYSSTSTSFDIHKRMPPNNLQNNVFVYSNSALKDCITVIYIIIKLGEKHKLLKLIYGDTVKKYSDFACSILDSTKNVKHIHAMLTEEKALSGLSIIDMVAYGDMQDVLNNPSVDRIVFDFWNGPYETQSWLNLSPTYSEIQVLFFNKEKFMGQTLMKPKKYWIEYLKPKKKVRESKGAHRSHFFQFKQWKYSLKVNFIMETIIILVLSIVIYDKALNSLQSLTEVQTEYNNYKYYSSEIDSGLYSGADLATLNTELAGSYEDLIASSRKFFPQAYMILYFSWTTAPFVLKNV